jgi:hypothetical protein
MGPHCGIPFIFVFAFAMGANEVSNGMYKINLN